MQRWLRRQSTHRRSRSWAGVAGNDEGASDGQALIDDERSDVAASIATEGRPAPGQPSSASRHFPFGGRLARERSSSRDERDHHPPAARPDSGTTSASPRLYSRRDRAHTHSATEWTSSVGHASHHLASSSPNATSLVQSGPASGSGSGPGSGRHDRRIGTRSSISSSSSSGSDGNDSAVDAVESGGEDNNGSMSHASGGVAAAAAPASLTRRASVGGVVLTEGDGTSGSSGGAGTGSGGGGGGHRLSSRRTTNDATTQTGQAAPHIDDTEIVAELHRTAIQDNANQLVKLLVGSEIDANSTFTRTERPILHVAASLGAHDCLCYLIRLGADVNKRDSAGRTALHLAARNGHRRIIETLVKQFDADVGIADNEGYTAMHWLASNGHLNYLDLLLSVGPGVNFEDHTGRTPLHVACYGGHAACAQYLIQKGADIHKRDHSGRDALFFACKVGAVECAELLIRLGAKLVSDADHVDAFNVCLHGKHSDCSALLIRFFPQLLARIVHIGAIQLYDTDVVCQTLSAYARTSSAALKVTTEAVAHLTATEGQHLLCLTNDEAEHTEGFVKVVRVLHTLLEPSRNATQGAKPTRQQHAAAVLTATHEIVRPMWDHLGAWLDLMRVEIDAEGRERCCYSSACRSGRACYGPTCCRVVDTALSRRRIGGTVTEIRRGLAATAADRVVTLLSAFHNVRRRTDGKLDPEVHSFFAAHRRVITWLIARDVSVLFKRLNFILGHDCLHHLFKDAIRSEPFESRRAWFYEHIEDANHSNDHDWSMPVLTVTRKNLFHSSCELFLPQDDLGHPRGADRDAAEVDGPPSRYIHKQPFAIRFESEPGIGDGVKREWFELLVREILNPNYGLFTPSADQTTYQPNPDSSINPDHLSYLEFAGRILGLAVYHRHPLSIHFTRSFYKHMLGKPAHLQDAESLDPEYMQSINWILENDISEAGLDLNFSTEHNSFGKTEHVELLPGGADIPVTDENKHGYVQLLVAQKLDKGIRKQIASFCKGLWSFVPRPLLALFDEYELELLISGIPTIDVADWRSNTAYSGYTEDSPTVRLFWQVIEEFHQPERALVLQFSTGSSRVPIGGFANLGGDTTRPFTLSRDDNLDHLPSASTCFNLLRMPEYATADALRDKLLLALEEATEGFAFS